MDNPNGHLQTILDDWLSSRKKIRVLEAGCGSTSHLRFPADAELVGIDLSQDQLDQNLHLHEKILGDLEEFPLRENDFDLIISWDVIEHLPHPKKALANLFRAVRPGGIIILATTNLLSLKGMVTKLTPFAFHKWFYRYVMGDKSVGTKQFRQFPTHLISDIIPKRLMAHAKEKGLTVKFHLEYEGPVQRDLRKKYPPLELFFWPLGFVSQLVTLGAINANHSDMMIVLEKPV